MKKQRTIYYISGSTGLLAKELGHALQSQFPTVEFTVESFHFIQSKEKAVAVREKILKESTGREKPLILSTLLRPELAACFTDDAFVVLPVYDTFLNLMEQTLGESAARRPGLARREGDNAAHSRAEAIHYSIAHDDGVMPDDYDAAQLIILGVSRSGKTPISIFIATKMGLRTANYPLIPQVLESGNLPAEIVRNLHKVVGLTISPKLLSRFREKRLSGSRYAQTKTCEDEVARARAIYQKHDIPVIASSGASIEETAMQVYLAFTSRVGGES